MTDFERGELKRTYKSCALPTLKKMPAPRWDLINGRAYGKGVVEAIELSFADDTAAVFKLLEFKEHL